VHRGTSLDAKSTRESRAQTCVRGTWKMKGSVKRGVSWCQKMIKGSGQAYRCGKDERRG